MESSPLNNAHQQERQAEALLKQNKFEECIECHKNAIVFLMKSMTLTDNHKSLESLKLQKLYHIKQIDIVKKKQRHYDKFMKTKLNSNRNNSNSSIDLDMEFQEDALKTAIFNNIVVQDSLIDRLEKRRFANDYDSFSTSDTDEKSAVYDKLDGFTNTLGNKHPKDDSTTIEELRMLSSQLQDLVQILVTQLDERNKEVEHLKCRIKQLESNQNKASKSNSLKVVTDSSGGTSPYVFSPCSELSPDVHELGSLPSLTPLDLPKFDYNNVYKSNSNTVNNINNN